MTISGKSHQAVTCARANRLVTIRATTIAAAMVQSSPTIKSYQNRPKPTRNLTVTLLRSRLQHRLAPAPQHLDEAIRDHDICSQEAQDRHVLARPRRAGALRGPEGAEGREQQPNRELEPVLRHAG